VRGGGGGEEEGRMYGRPNTAGLLHTVCDPIQILQNCLPAPIQKPRRGGASNRFLAAARSVLTL
jgi:hypothetical protein